MLNLFAGVVIGVVFNHFCPAAANEFFSFISSVASQLLNYAAKFIAA